MHCTLIPETCIKRWLIKSSLNWDLIKPVPLAYRASALNTELLRPDHTPATRWHINISYSSIPTHQVSFFVFLFSLALIPCPPQIDRRIFGWPFCLAIYCQHPASLRIFHPLIFKMQPNLDNFQVTTWKSFLWNKTRFS